MELFAPFDRMEGMPRTARDLPPDSATHLIARGVERRSIFLRAEDHLFFLSQMKSVFDQYAVSVLNYMLMPNHFHIEALTGSVPIGIPMQKLLTRYALYFNRVYERVGHLFENRFKSFEVGDEAYLVQLAVYISRNPVKAGLVDKPERWEWSGHNEIVSGKNRYLDFSRLEAAAGMKPERWKESYLRLLGRGDPTLAASPSIDEIIEFAALMSGISGKDLCNGQRGQAFSDARRIVAKEAAQRNYPQVDVAKALGISAPALAELLRIRKRDTPLRKYVCPLS